MGIRLKSEIDQFLDCIAHAHIAVISCHIRMKAGALQVVNGLMDRPDWKDAIKFPIGCLPGGSGNALSCAISYSAG